MNQTNEALITELDTDFEPFYFQEIDKLSVLKNEILKKMEMIDSLNLTFKEKNQISFLKTFQKIMNDLSEQLKNAVEAYQNIDQEIQRDPKCIFLSKQALFYKKERQVLDLKYNEELFKLHEVKMKNLDLKQMRDQLRRKSVHSQEKFLKYIDKNKSFSLRFGQMNEITPEKKKTQTHKKITESTKYHTPGNKTRIPSFNSVNRRTFFENIELQDEKSNKTKNYSLSKNRLKKIATSENVSPCRKNNFF